MIYQDKIQKLKNALEAVTSLEELEKLEREYLGKKGLIRMFLKRMGALPKEKKKVQGLAIQEMKAMAQKLFSQKEAELKKNQLEKTIRDQKEDLDLTVPKIGHLHPITQTTRMMNKFFIENIWGLK